MRHVARVLVATLMGMGLWGCTLWEQSASVSPVEAPPAGEPPAADSQAEAAGIISDRLGIYQQVEGGLQAEADSSRFVAYFEDGDLRYLVERIDFAPNGSEINEYYFENRRLFYFTQNRRVAPVEAPSVDVITSQLAFDANGTLVRAVRNTNGAPVEVPTDDILAVRLRAELLDIAATELRLRSRRAGNGSNGTFSNPRRN